MNDQVEEYYEDEEEEEYEPGSFRRWGIIIGIGIGVVCLGLIAVMWIGRKTLLAPLARLNATDTPLASNTPEIAATDTLVPPTPTLSVPDTETPAPSPTPLKLPALEIMSMISGPPVLSDKFDDNSKNWAGWGDSTDFTVQEGNLVLRTTQADKPALVYCSGECGPYKDNYYYEAEMVDERASNSGFGVIFGLNGQKSAYYVYKVRPATNEYGLFKFQNGVLNPLVDWTASPAVLPAPQANTLGVSFIKDTISMFLNGARVNTYQDRSPTGEGQIGLIVDQDGARLMASEATVYELLPRNFTPGAVQPPPGATAPPGAAQPVFTQPSVPTASGPTITPTRAGSCPAYVPEGQFLLVVTATQSPQGRKTRIEINNQTYELKDLNTPFYLPMNQKVVVRTTGQTYEYFISECKVVYVRAK